MRGTRRKKQSFSCCTLFYPSLTCGMTTGSICTFFSFSLQPHYTMYTTRVKVLCASSQTYFFLAQLHPSHHTSKSKRISTLYSTLQKKKKTLPFVHALPFPAQADSQPSMPFPPLKCALSQMCSSETRRVARPRTHTHTHTHTHLRPSFAHPLATLPSRVSSVLSVSGVKCPAAAEPHLMRAQGSACQASGRVRRAAPWSRPGAAFHAAACAGVRLVRCLATDGWRAERLGGRGTVEDLASMVCTECIGVHHNRDGECKCVERTSQGLRGGFMEGV